MKIPKNEGVFYGGGDATPLPDVDSERRRNEIDELLTMAEELQDKIERSTQQFLTTSLSFIIALALALITFGFVLFTVSSSLYKISIAGAMAVFVLIAALIVTRTQSRFQLQQRRDRRALEEVLSILHEVEPIFRAAGDWSRLDEARLKIRLSRFDVGRIPKPTGSFDKGIDRFTRTMRFLLDETNGHYRQFVERLFRNIDVAVKNLMEASDFDEVLMRARAHADIVSDEIDFNRIVNDAREAKASPTASMTIANSHLIGGQWGGGMASYVIFSDGRIIMNKAAKRDFDARQQQLRIQLGETR